MAAKKVPEAIQTSVSVNYSVGVKANLGNYESADVHYSRSESWDVTGLTKEEADELYTTRLVEISLELDELAQQGYSEMKEK